MFNRTETAAILNAVKEVASLRAEISALRAEVERLRSMVDRPMLTVTKGARNHG